MKETDLIYKVASLYFEDNLTQQQIAGKMGISRIKVSRLLQQARNKGIVEISLKKPLQNYTEEEKVIAGKWNLKEVILAVPETDTIENLLKSLGETASLYAQRILDGDEVISMAWGKTLAAFAQAFPKLDLPKLRIVQMLGGLGSPEAQEHSSDLVRRLAEKTGGKGRILSAPGVVSSYEVRNGLLEDSHIRKTLEMAAGADIAFVGIGNASTNSMLMSQGQILPEDTLASIKERGGVGDISLRFLNIHGEVISHSIKDRIIGISDIEIKKIPRVIAVAGGNEKYEAIQGALESGLLDVLITDYETGKKLMDSGRQQVGCSAMQPKEI